MAGIYGNVYLDGDHADESDVRLGTDYNNGDLTGTLVVSGGGSGDATLAKQEEILAALSGKLVSVTLLDSISIVGIPASLYSGDDYTEESNRAIKVSLYQSDGTTPLANNAFGSYLLDDVTAVYYAVFEPAKNTQRGRTPTVITCEFQEGTPDVIYIPLPSSVNTMKPGSYYLSLVGDWSDTKITIASPTEITILEQIPVS